jgi:mandelate racemase
MPSGNAPPPLSIRGLRARPVDVPMRRPLKTSGGLVGTAPLVLIDLATAEGFTGRSYLFCYTPLALQPVVTLLDAIAGLIVGDPVAPFDVERKLARRFTLLGRQGLTGMALAGIDMACWDALAVAARLPLARLLGGVPRPIPAYNSCGLGLIGPEKAPEEARALCAGGFGAIKVRLGYPTLAEDLEVVRAVRKAIPDHVLLMSDYNQSLSVTEALRRGHALAGENLYWIEEPTRADDYAGHARIAGELATPIQIGESLWGPSDMEKALTAGACDYVMPDVMKIGGVSGWLRAAALAEPIGLPMSSHLFPEVSAQLLAVTPTCHWLEYVDWASPVLADPLMLSDGQTVPRETPGLGLDWDETAVARFLVR